MAEGCSSQAFETCLAADRPEDWSRGAAVVATEGSTGFGTATTEVLPVGTSVMDCGW